MLYSMSSLMVYIKPHLLCDHTHFFWPDHFKCACYRPVVSKLTPFSIHPLHLHSFSLILSIMIEKWEAVRIWISMHNTVIQYYNLLTVVLFNVSFAILSISSFSNSISRILSSNLSILNVIYKIYVNIKLWIDLRIRFKPGSHNNAKPCISLCHVNLLYCKHDGLPSTPSDAM